MAAPASQTVDVTAAIMRADQLLRRGRLAEAAPQIAALQNEAPERSEAWLLGARLAQMEGDFFAMLDQAQRGVAASPRSLVAALVCAEAEIMAGETAAARERLARLEAEHCGDPVAPRRAAEMYTHLGQHADADRCAQAALALRPDDADSEFQAASYALAMGRIGEAERLLDDVLMRRPGDFDAAYNRATLRRQTAERNHVPQLQSARAQLEPDRVPPALHYALGKELEDLGDADAAFNCFARGAAARRHALSYDVGIDVEAMRQIAATFGADFFAAPGAGFEAEAPIFVVGLPRSGTTLVDRILSSHREVESRGELNELALAVTRAAGRSADKAARIARAARAEMTALGQGYCRAVRGAGASGRVFLDKTPLNFLYLGVIARALPNAKIVHLTRHPMASGFAMLKTLFRMGYPFSYAQDDIGRYIGAYRRLMQHWRTLMGARILDVAYEDVVADIEGQTRRMLEFCALPWDAACVAFHTNQQPSTTASAAQVRQPLYTSSVDQWRRHEAKLELLARTLREEGVL
ncbi:MAG: sulfotransferase [Hyphomonadaceae bacterium]|nr:sulfotransferase [Hyphomonadaceae bacterium]